MRCWILMVFMTMICPATVFANSVAVGINYTGAQISVDFHKLWAAEARYLLNNEDTEAGQVSSRVIGVRLYRFLPARKAVGIFFGLETAYDMSAQSNGSLKSSGYSAGVFTGMRYMVSRRVAIGADIGPYFTSMSESQTSLSDSSVDFVFNSFVSYYLW